MKEACDPEDMPTGGGKRVSGEGKKTRKKKSKKAGRKKASK